jgi:hypothetical protein
MLRAAYSARVVLYESRSRPYVSAVAKEATGSITTVASEPPAHCPQVSGIYARPSSYPGHDAIVRSYGHLAYPHRDGSLFIISAM